MRKVIRRAKEQTQSLLAIEDIVDSFPKGELVCCRCGEALAEDLDELIELFESGELAIGRLMRGRGGHSFSMLHKDASQCSRSYDKQLFRESIGHNTPTLEAWGVSRSTDGGLILTEAPKQAPKAKVKPKVSLKKAPKKAPKAKPIEYDSDKRRKAQRRKVAPKAGNQELLKALADQMTAIQAQMAKLQ